MPNFFFSVQCKKYIILNDRTRNINYGRGGQCDARGYSTKINGKSNQWYRFQAPAGNKMPDKPPNNLQGQRCGTAATGYLLGGHPTKAGQVVSRKVCFSFSGQKCLWKDRDSYKNPPVTVKVTHCGAFFVYQLPYPPGCSGRYCAEK